MITLTNEDNMELMSRYPDAYFDLAIVDPPYGNYKLKENKNVKMFDNIEPPESYFNELKRVSKNQIIWGFNYFKNINLNGGCIIWNKLGIDTNRRKQAPTMSDAELAYHSFNNLVKIFSYTWIGNVTSNKYVINSNEFKNRIHPTQKPIDLYKWVLKNYANEGDKILDTHLGSGSIAIACHDYGFDLTACELDTEYYQAALKRYNNHIQQIQLF
jgi:site-specific DNA-methyltransferase (adenine-specific)